MPTDPPTEVLDLLVVGALSVDRLVGDVSMPGGSVLHAARALARRGRRVGVATTAGPEPEALAGLAELGRITALLEVAPHPTTVSFRHRESPAGRRLWLEQAGGDVVLGSDAYGRIRTHAILYAPVADEIDPAALMIWPDAWARAAILQGWLREMSRGAEVVSRPLGSLPVELREALASMDLLVASHEDLRREAASPHGQLTALRAAFGRHPTLVVSHGSNGLWVDVPGAQASLDRREHLPVPTVVGDVPTVGAGDVLAACLAMRSDDPTAGWRTHAESAMHVVASELASRRAPG